MGLRRVLDVFFCGFFLFQIPSTIFFDTQALFPSWLYPHWICAKHLYPLCLYGDMVYAKDVFVHISDKELLRNLRTSYLAHYRDPFMGDLSSFPWFMAICSIEFPVQIPFYFVAAYAYYKGAERCPWIRIPSLLYSVHVATSVLGVLFSVCLMDFSVYTVPAPRDIHERTRLFFVYFPFFASSVMLMLDTCLSSAYIRRKDKSE